MKSLVLALVLVALTGQPAAAQIYHWMDDGGVDYYTTDPNRIPLAYLDGVRVLQSSPRGPVPAPAPPLAEPVAREPTLRIPDPPVSEAATPAEREGTLVATGGPVLVTGSLNGITLTLLVDTGASKTMISPATLSRAGFDPLNGQQVRVLGVTGTADAIEVVLPGLDVAGTQVGPLRVVAHEVPGAGVDGLLGRDILGRFTLTIDVARGRATLAP